MDEITNTCAADIERHHQLATSKAEEAIHHDTVSHSPVTLAPAGCNAASVSAAVEAGVPQADCSELTALLRTASCSDRAMTLAVLIASEIPDAVAERVTEAYLVEHAAMATEATAEELALLGRLRSASNFNTEWKN